MDFFRRLFGIQTAPKESTAPTVPTPEISAPGTPVEAAPAPIVQNPEKRSTTEINEAARTDPTPMLFGGTRQLPPLETFISKPGKHVVYGMGSDIGMIRGNN